MRSTAAAPLFAIACLLPVQLIPFRARAQASGPKVNAQIQKLFDDASAEMDAGQFQSACPKLERVVELQPDGLGARITLAECYEGMSEPHRAWQTCSDTKLAAVKAKNAKRAQDAERCMTRLDPKVAKVILNVSDQVRFLPDVKITLDGARVDPLSWGAPLAVLGGTHVVVATAPGKLPWRKSVTAQQGGTPQPIDVDALTTAASSSPGSNAGGPPTGTDAGAPGAPSPISQASSAQAGTASASTAQKGASAQGSERQSASERAAQQGAAREGAARQGKIQGTATQRAAQPAAGAPLAQRVDATDGDSDDESDSRRRALGTIALGFGGAGAVVATVLGTIALRVEDKGNALGTASLITLATSGVLLAAGGALILTSGPSSSNASVVLNPQGVSAQLRW